MTSLNPHESTPESEARHGEPAPASIDEDTPEARLLARKGSAKYLEDVRSLIAERDRLAETLAEATSVLSEQREAFAERDGMIESLSAEVERLRRSLAAAPTTLEPTPARWRDRVFGTIRTERMPDE